MRPHDRNRESLNATPYLFCFIVALASAGGMLGLLVAVGRTNALQNLLLIALVTLVLTFATALGVTGSTRSALIASSVFTCVVLGVGWGLLYAFFAAVCGASPSSC
jgi:VIT1/CCC1 family predicted Fe2+/Mn2+ transporter